MQWLFLFSVKTILCVHQTFFVFLNIFNFTFFLFHIRGIISILEFIIDQLDNINLLYAMEDYQSLKKEVRLVIDLIKQASQIVSWSTAAPEGPWHTPANKTMAECLEDAACRDTFRTTGATDVLVATEYGVIGKLSTPVVSLTCFLD